MAYLSVKDGRVKPTGYKGGKLTPKMRSFVDAFFGAANFNAIKAIELSDYTYSNKHASNQHAAQLMQHPSVIAEIARRQELRTEKSEVKAEYLIQKLMKIIEATEVDNPNAALRAIELAGKSIALWKERQEITGADGEAIKHEQHIKESVADFTSRISSLVDRAATDGATVIPFRGGASRT